MSPVEDMFIFVESSEIESWSTADDIVLSALLDVDPIPILLLLLRVCTTQRNQLIA